MGRRFIGYLLRRMQTPPIYEPPRAHTHVRVYEQSFTTHTATEVLVGLAALEVPC